MAVNKYQISVIIPSCNRAHYLRSSLESLTNQTLERSEFEVIVVDDGSTDETSSVCFEFQKKLNLKYAYINNSGISAAKNLGLFISTAPISFFFDDDDTADRNLLREHIRYHQTYPDETVAVLGKTDWASELPISEVMRFINEVGYILFAYPLVSEIQFLDFSFFWGGRSSCKRSFLVTHGVFHQKFKFGYEDIELGYRLSKAGLRVVYNKDARQFMNRSLTLKEVCVREQKKGAAKRIFTQMHPDKVIQNYCQMQNAKKRFALLSKDLDIKCKLAHQLDNDLKAAHHNKNINCLKTQLYNCYRHIFEAYHLKGFIEAKPE